MMRKFAGFLLLCITFGMTMLSAGDSHIVADPTAPGNQQPQVLGTGGCLPQVNINTPNSNGLSYNRYQQFDVGQQGAILNNSMTNVQTQLGGWIERNPQFTGQTIRLISCDTGALPNGLAQNLANKLGVPVIAPTQKGIVFPTGRFVVQGTVGGGRAGESLKPESWINFKPGGGR